MKKTILIVYICLFPYLLLGNELIIGEYYLDFDPGIGFANEFTFVSNEVINLIDSINYSNLSDGFHSFNFRIKDENGLWSFTQSIQFYVFKDKFVITTPPIEQIEYFIDKDLGIGNNHKINMIKENDINILDSLENVLIEPGFHTFNMRLIDTSGKSGYNQSFPFYVFKKREEPVICPIEQIDLFY